MMLAIAQKIRPQLRRASYLALLLATTACAPGSPLLDHDVTIAEKAGSRALADGQNLEQAGKFNEAAGKYRDAEKQAIDAEIRARALTELADLYGAGLGVPQNLDKQEVLLKEAAALGYPNATFKLAEIYRGGEGVQNMPEHLVRPNTARDLLNSIKTEYPYAAALLIEMHKEGQISAGDNETQKLITETLTGFEELAEKGDSDAMLALARLYRDGLIGQPDKTKMEQWYRKSIAAGNLNAASELGLLWAKPDSGRSPQDALALLKQVALHDELGASAAIGDIYERLGNKKEAVIWYQKAAANPKPRRTIYMKLAQAYATGWGVEKNDATALEWYKKAANAGSVKASAQVIRAYMKGIGVAANPAEADAWMEKMFAERPDRLYPIAKSFAAGVDLPQSLPKAFALAMRAAENGNKKAMRYVARAYEKGLGVTADAAKANQWYAKAGIVRSAGKGTKKSESPLYAEAKSYEIKGENEKAFALYSQAAEQGDSMAMMRVALSYTTGVGVGQDVDKAYIWYRKAAEAGNAEAQYHLGLGYARGFGVEKDIGKARVWLEKASNNGYPLAAATLKTLEEAGR